MGISGKQIRYLAYWLILLLVLATVIAKSYRSGTDINVYLYASQQLFHHENIYADNPYNDYLYSPLFAFLLGGISFLDFTWARILWALINVVLVYRLWILSKNILAAYLQWDGKKITWWTVGVFAISIGALLHNLNLGQITVVIMWLTFEGLYQVMIKKKNLKGAALLALGINIKIIPLLGLYYLFLKKKFRALFYTGGFVIISLLLPGLFVGNRYNVELLENWKNKINPTGKKYLFEKSNGCSSLNAIVPAYFFFFGDPPDNDRHGWKRKIAYLPDKPLLYIIQALRILLVLGIAWLVYYTFRRGRENPLYFYWEMAFMMSVTILLFPHQMKYALLYFAPAGGYLIAYLVHYFSSEPGMNQKRKWIAWSILTALVMFTISGRDILGEKVVDVIDFYHVQGLIVIFGLVMLIVMKPGQLSGESGYDVTFKRGMEV